MNQNQPSSLHNSQFSKVRRLDKNFGHELIIKTNTTQPSFSKATKKSHDEHQRPEEAPSLTDAAESAMSLFSLRTLGMWPSCVRPETQLKHLYLAFEDDFKL